MKSNISKFTLRTDAELLAKLSYIADYNGRSSNRELEMLIKHHINAFEKEHGSIVLSDK